MVNLHPIEVHNADDIWEVEIDFSEQGYKVEKKTFVKYEEAISYIQNWLNGSHFNELNRG